MASELHKLRPVEESEPDSAPQSCRNCKKRNRKIEKLQKDKAALEQRVEHLLRALRRESHYLDKRAPHTGR
jgi:hypothetical protein